MFTIHIGHKKVVVLAGYKTVKQALVNYAEEFGDRDITPVFYDFNKGHGKVLYVSCSSVCCRTCPNGYSSFCVGLVFSNGESWKEMRRFALTNLRDFGMGKKMSEEKIIQECHYLIDTIEKHEGNQICTVVEITYIQMLLSKIYII